LQEFIGNTLVYLRIHIQMYNYRKEFNFDQSTFYRRDSGNY
jgi:hypothetical protein